METREIVRRTKSTFPEKVLSVEENGTFPFIEIRLDALKAILSFCTHDPEMRFDFLECITALDSGKTFTMVYQLFSTTLAHRLNIKVELEREAPRISSVTGFWRAAYAYELEIAEMFGIQFDGHPGLRKLLLPDDWEGHPLRKDYVYPEQYQGVEHARKPLRKEHTRP